MAELTAGVSDTQTLNRKYVGTNWFLGEQETNLQIIFADGNSIVSGGWEVHSDSFVNDLVSDHRRKIARLLELRLHI